MSESSAFSFALDYRYRKSDDVFTGASRIANPSRVNTEFHQFALTGSSRMNQNWLFSTRLPFTDAIRREIGQADKTINGLGDISISTMYSPWRGEDTAWSNFSFTAGLILPTGESQSNPRTGLTSPSVFQLGTGTTQLTLGVRNYGTLAKDWSYFVSANYTLPLYESSKDFRPAETFFLSSGVRKSLFKGLTTKLSFDLFHGEHDEFQGSEITNTGSTVLTLTPALIYSLNERLAASASVALPVYRRVNQTALAAGPVWSLGMSYTF